MVRWILEIKMIFYFGVTPGVLSAISKYKMSDMGHGGHNWSGQPKWNGNQNEYNGSVEKSNRNE